MNDTKRIIQNNLFRTSSQEVCIVCDIDDTIVNISPRWTLDAIAAFLDTNRDFTKDSKESLNLVRELISLPEEEFNQRCLERPDYYINDWLNIPSDIVIESIKASSGFIYDNLELNKLGDALKQFASIDVNSRIHFVTHTIDGASIDSKRSFIDRHFGNRAVFHNVPLDECKAEYINKHEIPYTHFADDRIDIIEDFVTKTNALSKEFIIPNLGFNQPSDKLVKLIDSLYSTVGSVKTY